jgi:putative DNA primase/helicase
VLQYSKNKVRKNVWTLFATGNNLVLFEDVTRRVLLCRLDAGEERPLSRKFVRNPFEKVMVNRGQYIWAALTVVRAYIVAGRPGRLPGIGDPFSEWSDSVRSMLVWLGWEDPVLSMEAGRASDPVRQTAAALFQAIVNAYGVGEGNSRRSADMIRDADNGSITPRSQLPLKREFGELPDEGAVRLQEAMVVAAGHGRIINPKWFGTWLGKHQNRSIDGLRLRAAYDSHNKVNWWYIEKGVVI